MAIHVCHVRPAGVGVQRQADEVYVDEREAPRGAHPRPAAAAAAAAATAAATAAAAAAAGIPAFECMPPARSHRHDWEQSECKVSRLKSVVTTISGAAKVLLNNLTHAHVELCLERSATRPFSIVTERPHWEWQNWILESDTLFMAHI